MSSHLPLSVIIPTCSISPTLWEAIDSVLVADQVCSVGEILVVPNAGEANQTMADQIDARYFGTKVRCVVRNLSGIIPIFRNWNECVGIASYELIHILHDDDILACHFYLQIAHLSNRWPDASLYYSAVVRFGESDGYVCPVNSEGIWEDAKFEMAKSNCLLCPGVVFRKMRHNGFNENLVFAADWEAWAMLVSQGDVVISPFAAALYRVHGANTTAKLLSSGKGAGETYEVSKRISEILFPDISPIERVRMTNHARCVVAINLAYRGKYGSAFLTLCKVATAGHPVRALLGHSKSIIELAFQRWFHFC